MLTGKRGLLFIKEATFRKSIAENIASSGGFVYTYKKLEEFLKSFAKDRPDFILLDDKTAMEQKEKVVRSVRSHSTLGNVPILVLSASLSLQTRRDLIQAGVDRVLKQKLEHEILALEIFSLLRRSQAYRQAEENLDFGEISVNPHRHQVSIGGREIKLTGIEYKVFLELISKKGEVVSREMLAKSFLSFRNSSDRTLDVHINALRKKLGPQGKNLTTIRGRGYMFRA